MNPIDERFLQAALAEGGMPITAGYVPDDGNPLPPEQDRPLYPVWGSIARLPRWAQVAFAARCAQRVLHILERDFEKRSEFIPFELGNKLLPVDTLSRAVQVAAEAAKQAIVGIAVAERCLWARDLCGPREGAAFHAAAAAYMAAHPRGYAGDVTQHAIEAAASACSLLASAPITDKGKSSFTQKETEIQKAAQNEAATKPAKDLNLLLQLSIAQKWTDDTPVPPEVFGPLWDGMAPYWMFDYIVFPLPRETPETKDPSSVRAEPGSE
jgi:hypothetical protein